MTCPDCGYMMTAFDKDCPRCKEMKAKGLPVKPLPIKPQNTGDQLPIHSRPSIKPVAGYSSDAVPVRPLRVAQPETSVVSVEPAPLIIYMNRVVNWKPYVAAILVLVLVVGAYGWWRSAQDAITQAMVKAAREGACERMPGFDSDREQRACQQLSSALTYTVTREADEKATVLFYLDGVTSSLAVQINKDEKGDWHAVSAKEGDEGGRREYDKSVVRTWTRQEPPQTPEIGGPTALPSSGANTTLPNQPDSTVPNNSTSPATNVTPPAPTGTYPEYSITTKAGGGAPPDTSMFK